MYCSADIATPISNNGATKVITPAIKATLKKAVYLYRLYFPINHLEKGPTNKRSNKNAVIKIIKYPGKKLFILNALLTNKLKDIIPKTITAQIEIPKIKDSLKFYGYLTSII